MTEVLITSSVLIVVLLVMRKLFRNTLSRRVQYALWGLVLLRLLIPESLPAVDFSVLTAVKPAEQAVTRSIIDRPVYVPVNRAPLTEHPAAPAVVPERTEISEGGSVWVARTEDTAVQYKRLSVRTVLVWIWLAGSGVAVVFLALVNGRFWKKLRRRRKPFEVTDCTLPVYMVETGLSSPCLFGLFRPAIYLTPAAVVSPERMRHVLVHESMHARHLDHIWTFLHGICLAVYWFDPLVWAASAAAKADCELACDEGVLARLEESERIPYGQTLLSLIPVRRTVNPMLAATTMAAGKKQLKERFTRIAHKPRQMVAAVVVVILLAGIVSACTFTGAKKTDTALPGEQEGTGIQNITGEQPTDAALPESQEGAGTQTTTGANPTDAALPDKQEGAGTQTTTGAKPTDAALPESWESEGMQALTGDELRWFNEVFFNETDRGEAIPSYNICNQFANPLNFYGKPEDIDLFELFYCDGTGTAEISDEEIKMAFGMERDDLFTGVYKLTTEEINRVLAQYAGLTLDQTNRVGMENFQYLAQYDAYYWMHGDTNYPGNLTFLMGTRADSTIRLYQENMGNWYCVTLTEQEDGSYWFVSNQSCERPKIPTPMPADPEVVISLDGLEPYEAPAVTMERREHDFEDYYWNRPENWDIDGHNVMLYRSVDGILNAAIRNGETMNVFLADLDEEAHIFPFRDLFGHDGFFVSYYGQISEEPGAFGICENYYYFDEDGGLILLVHTAQNDNGSTVMDLDGDGADELASEREIFFQRDGRIYRIDLRRMVLDNCPALDYWYGAEWDSYAKCLAISGAGGNAGNRDVLRRLYFDGERLLLYKDE